MALDDLDNDIDNEVDACTAAEAEGLWDGLLPEPSVPGAPLETFNSDISSASEDDLDEEDDYELAVDI